MLFQAYSLLPAQEAQAINYTWALTMTLLAVPLLKQKLRLQDAMAALVCYLGVLVIGTRGQLLELHFSNQLACCWRWPRRCCGQATGYSNTRDTREPVLGLALNFASSLP
ncbi:Uncharacterised protein [Chromobacterium violaceum]|uniref:EamA domain-containing protein n=1 Tax=Chromobacterium violaceum TaxID=536 RepID=A0A3S4HTN2_CHRVL|nr:Uncharacterised protein [Chromobacterium violaceum]